MKKYLIIITISLFIIAGSHFAWYKWGFQKGKSSVKCPERAPVLNTIIIDNSKVDSLLKINEILKKQINEKPKIKIIYQNINPVNALVYDSLVFIPGCDTSNFGIFREWANYLNR